MARTEAIGAALPFAGWPMAALQRLAIAALPVSYGPGTLLYRNGKAAHGVAVVVAGTVEASVMAPDGRRVVFALDVAGRAYGLIPLIDDGPMTNDVTFVSSGIALEIPFAAVHTELAADPMLWASMVREVNARGRRFTEQLKSFLLDALRLRAASLLLGLLPPQRHKAPMSSTIELRLSQERFAEMLGVSRQSASVLVRDFASDGLLTWRYGRVTLLDGARLKALADAGIGQLAHRHAPPRDAAPSAGRGAFKVSSAC